MLCVKCQKRPAVVFVQRLENGKPVQEGYCLTCARAMHIQPVDDLMKQFGMSDQDLENMEERMSSFLQEAAESGMMAPVSYTHLDVYKRQPCGRTALCWTSRPPCLTPTAARRS